MSTAQMTITLSDYSAQQEVATTLLMLCWGIYRDALCEALRQNYIHLIDSQSSKVH
jgi:hypothetical protein